VILWLDSIRASAYISLVMQLRTARKIARLTQVELAARSGVDQRLISKIETGQVRQPGYETVVRLSRALNVEPGELFPLEIDEVQP
jgi:transcriptional regulator with XRE-family HTH domain